MPPTPPPSPDRDIARQRVLAEFGAFALQCADVALLYDEAAHRAAEAAGTAFAIVALHRPDRDDCLVVAGVGLPDGTLGLATLPGAVLTGAEHARDADLLLAERDDATSPDMDPADLRRRAGLRAVATAPIRSGGIVQGVLEIGRRAPEPFTDVDLYTLQSLATLLGAAIHRLEVEAERDVLLAVLQEKEQRYRFATESIPQIVWTAEPDGRVDYYNRRWTDYTGISVDQGREEWDSALHPEDEARTVEAWRHSVATGAPYEIEHRIRRRDGGYRWMLSRAWPLRSPGGRLVKWFGSATDIDTERQAQQALTEARDAAERANRAKSRFLAAASHDLRQPLNAVILLMEVLRPRLTDPALSEILDRMEGSLRGMVELFEALLDLSKLEGGGVQLHVEPLPLAPMLAKLERDFGPAAQAKGLRFRIRATRSWVRSDATLLERILRNLVANAVRYTDQGGILVGLRQRGDRLRIEVVDTGPGIPPEQREEIFDEFQQLGNEARERAGGHGLGLAIVRRAAAILGHRILVGSRLGHGSCFALELEAADPLIEADGPADEADGPELPRSGSFPVLLLEDDPLVLTATRLVLEDFGCTVTAARTAGEAVALVRSGNAPVLVIADYRLPGQTDGLDAVRQIRDLRGADLPALLVTGDVTGNVEPRARAAGVRVLRKPVRPEELRAVVEAVQRA